MWISEYSDSGLDKGSIVVSTFDFRSQNHQALSFRCGDRHWTEWLVKHLRKTRPQIPLLEKRVEVVVFEFGQRVQELLLDFLDRHDLMRHFTALLEGIHAVNFA